MIIPPFPMQKRTVLGGDHHAFAERTIYPLIALCFCILASIAQTSGATGLNAEVLKAFTATDGAHPFSDLVQTSDGQLYGTTVTGNNSIANDTIYKLNPDGSGFTVVKNLNTTEAGGNCYGGLLLGADGMLYGAAFTSGRSDLGTVFRLNRDGSGFAVLQNFNGNSTGGQPYGRLAQGKDGALYGTTFTGGAFNAGTLYKLNSDGTGFRVLVDFNQAVTGGNPYAGVIQGADGALYGTTLYGGVNGGGTVFRLNPDGSGYTVLVNFSIPMTGGFPNARLVQGADRALYGTNGNGGSSDGGTIFKVNTDGSNFTTLKNLAAKTTGNYPIAELAQGNDGTFYGTTLQGGTFGGGTVFRIQPDGTEFTVLQNLQPATSGSSPYAGVIQGMDGAIYGAAGYGGSGDYGTIFRLVPPTNSAPTAVPGPNLSIHAGTVVQLNGSASFDDNTASASLGYAWSFTSRPTGSAATLNGANLVTPSFTADMTGTYVVQLVVTDLEGMASAPASVQFSSYNQAPTSVATVDASLAIIGQAVHFDGSASTDPDGDVLGYSWMLTSLPIGSTAVLINSNSAHPALTPDREGDYQIVLTTSDFLGAGNSAVLTITATTASSFATGKIVAACNIVDGFSDNKMSKGHRIAFCNLLRSATKDLQENHLAQAIEKLNQALSRTDGCALRATVDGNGAGMDWITDCAAQSQVYEPLTAAVHALTP